MGSTLFSLSLFSVMKKSQKIELTPFPQTRIGPTVLLMSLALLVAYLFATPIGTLSAINKKNNLPYFCQACILIVGQLRTIFIRGLR
ncbi:MAG: hypothetical protein DDT30_01700 [Dehalococcoidia bacterium]|nr:hypothetical protein [Bacillota bacterium]MBT9163423.1 hypothetical protein [Chloroflexota bacterium]MBT9166434.1 hypothetical protein [Chloroflexota bacterium]